MKPVNIILKAFDGDPYDKLTLARALKNLHCDTCVSIANDTTQTPEVHAKEHIWIPAAPLRVGRYTGFDWTAITPLDEGLIESMRHCEAVFMQMLGRYTDTMKRYAHTGEIPYHERRRQYFDHLRFFNHLLESKQIGLVLMNHEPHQCYDYVLYSLCKLKGIPLLYLDRVFTVDGLYLTQDWEASALPLRDRLASLRTEYADPESPVPLSENFEIFFEKGRSENPRAGKEDTEELPKDDKKFLTRWWKTALKVLRKNPAQFFRSICSPQFWSHKFDQHRALQFYTDHIQPADLSVRYVYLPLHFQPESSTLPLAGAYADQERMVQLLAASLPPDVLIYVKEHPSQVEREERWRSVGFYQSLIDLPNVRFIPKDTNTYALVDHAWAIATATGTVTFEAVLRQKPVFMFGHFVYQYAPGVHSIRTWEDCKRAVAEIAGKPVSHTVQDVRLFLKALEETTTPYPGPVFPIEHATPEEKAERVGALIEKRIKDLLGLENTSTALPPATIVRFDTCVAR